MEIRYSANPDDVKRYSTEELRREFLIEDLYTPDRVKVVYSHIDRMVVMGVMPVSKKLSVSEGVNPQASFGTEYFLERREIGLFNLGGRGAVSVDGAEYPMEYKDCLYIAKGAKDVFFSSEDASNPARYYGVSAPAHRTFETKLISIKDAAKTPTGDPATSNKRVINQFIHPDVLETCQLMMGLTTLETGSVWNTMPVHTHERRMEVYTYFELPEGHVVFHLMGAPNETRHIVMKNGDAVLSPSWSIHAGAGTAGYTFIWAMGGENQSYTDMDVVPISEML
jgi:4-deoxy-L-threo-5-hexosulose-uronate ketol-isomerase